MATRKKNKKAASKKEKISNQTEPLGRIDEYDIVYDGDDDLYGTIVDHQNLPATKELINAVLERSNEKDRESYLSEDCIELYKKIKSTQDRDNVKFSKYELRIMKATLEHYFDYQIMEPEYHALKRILAWANTSFKNKGNSYEKNLREAGRRLQFTKGADKPIDLKKCSVFADPPKGKKLKYDPSKVKACYEVLLRKHPRIEAVKMLATKFEFNSLDACARYLRRNLGFKNVPTKPPRTKK